MDGGSPVSEHQDKLGLGEDVGQIRQGLEGKWVLVTETGCGLTVAQDDLVQGQGIQLALDPILCTWLLIHYHCHNNIPSH